MDIIQEGMDETVDGLFYGFVLGGALSWGTPTHNWSDIFEMAQAAIK